MHLPDIIRTSYQKAKRVEITETDKRIRNNQRSKLWVEALAAAFRTAYARDAAVKVFSKGYAKNRDDFGINELLYDITVCKIAPVASAIHKKELFYVQEALWEVESEFARDSRQALIDFNKLVLGSAANKLFIGPKVRDQKSFINVLIEPARFCSGNIYAAFLPHPGQWDEDDSEPEVFQLAVRKEWILMADSI